jgi:peptidoglycan/xylan/chitin deacetylase (PgdA/CDA1 family)
MTRIVNFHQVIDSVWFERVLCFLKSKYTLISMETFHEQYFFRKNIRNGCHITVDDGHKSFYEIIFPILKKHNVAASIYVSPKILKENANYWFQEVMKYDQISLSRLPLIC